MDVDMKEADIEQSQAEGPPKKDDTAPKSSTNAYELPWYCLWLFESLLLWCLNDFNVAKESEAADLCTEAELPSSFLSAAACALWWIIVI